VSWGSPIGPAGALRYAYSSAPRPLSSPIRPTVQSSRNFCTKIHAAANQGGKPIAFHLSGGNTAYLRSGEVLIEAVAEGALVIADRAFDADRFRRAVPTIPPKANRRWKSCFSPALYRGRNAIERMFCRLKDFRQVATRYDRLAAPSLAAVHIAAIVAFWV
jgi:transposase